MCSCISLCKITVHKIAQNSSDNLPSYPQDIAPMLSTGGEDKATQARY